MSSQIIHLAKATRDKTKFLTNPENISVKISPKRSNMYSRRIIVSESVHRKPNLVLSENKGDTSGLSAEACDYQNTRENYIDKFEELRPPHRPRRPQKTDSRNRQECDRICDSLLDALQPLKGTSNSNGYSNKSDPSYSVRRIVKGSGLLEIFREDKLDLPLEKKEEAVLNSSPATNGSLEESIHTEVESEACKIPATVTSEDFLTEACGEVSIWQGNAQTFDVDGDKEDIIDFHKNKAFESGSRTSALFIKEMEAHIAHQRNQPISLFTDPRYSRSQIYVEQEMQMKVTCFQRQVFESSEDEDLEDIFSNSRTKTLNNGPRQCKTPEVFEGQEFSCFNGRSPRQIRKRTEKQMKRRAKRNFKTCSQRDDTGYEPSDDSTDNTPPTTPDENEVIFKSQQTFT